jgi:lia operon protein LiaF
MLRQQKTDHASWLAMIAIILFLAELLLFQHGDVFFLLFAIGCMYIGRKRMPKLSGVVLFWFGLISFVISLASMVTFRLSLFFILVYIIWQYMQSKKVPVQIQPIMIERKHDESSLLERKPRWKNSFFSSQKTPERVYEWEDINIQGGISDVVIDLSYTVLPKGEAVIVIRHLIGNVQILVPYEVEVRLHHSVIYGSAIVFERKEANLWNETVYFQTKGYKEAEQKVKILTSMIIGTIEVKHV